LAELIPERPVTTVALAGPVTQTEVTRCRDSLLDGLARGRGLRIELAGSGPWDVAGLQLLLAAIASGQRAGSPVALAGVPNVLTAIAERAALLDRLAASIDV
jgi:ABC-type transporter Mla MlaB component